MSSIYFVQFVQLEQSWTKHKIFEYNLAHDCHLLSVILFHAEQVEQTEQLEQGWTKHQIFEYNLAHDFHLLYVIIFQPEQVEQTEQLK